MQHTVVYREPGRYAGWPANYGIWSWGEEIVAAFTVGSHHPGGGFHTRDRTRPFAALQARSLDGGRTWTSEPCRCATPGGRGLSADEHVEPELKISSLLDAGERILPSPDPIDFTAPELVWMVGRTGLSAGAISWFYTSLDRCRTWSGPFALGDLGLPGIAGRTDGMVDGPHQLTLFLTAAKSDGREGRVFCARTDDGGRSFQFRSWVGPEPEGYTIMPASIRLPNGDLLSMLRCRRRGPDINDGCWLDLYRSSDDGLSWSLVGRPAPSTGFGGNPATLTRLPDDRLCLIYGYRDAPFGIRARLSSDSGETWSDEVLLRTDGGCHDLGYPRTTLLPDGTLVTVYYFNDSPEGDRYIASTRWKP